MVFNLVFSRIYAVFYDLSSLGNFYNFSVDIIVLTLFSRFMHFVSILYAVLVIFLKIFLFQSADENSNIDIGAIY